MCFACWAAQPGNILRSVGGDIIGVYIPEGRFKVPGRGVYSCCICRAFCRNPTWFVEPPDDQPSCQHDPDTHAVREYKTLYHNRPNPSVKDLSAPSRRC
jgi:hypothetical protein